MGGQMSYDEFKKTIFYTKNKVIVPLLGRISIDKTEFLIKEKYSFKKEDVILIKIYEKNKDILK